MKSISNIGALSRQYHSYGVAEKYLFENRQWRNRFM